MTMFERLHDVFNVFILHLLVLVIMMCRWSLDAPQVWEWRIFEEIWWRDPPPATTRPVLVPSVGCWDICICCCEGYRWRQMALNIIDMLLCGRAVSDTGAWERVQQYNTYYHRLKWHNIQFQFYFIRFSQTTLKLWDTWKTPNHASNSFLNSHGFVNLMKRWSGDNIVILWFVMNGTRNWKMIACVPLRALNKPLRRLKFYNHKEGPYYGLLLPGWESTY